MGARSGPRPHPVPRVAVPSRHAERRRPWRLQRPRAETGASREPARAEVAPPAFAGASIAACLACSQSVRPCSASSPSSGWAGSHGSGTTAGFPEATTGWSSRPPTTAAARTRSTWPRLGASRAPRATGGRAGLRDDVDRAEGHRAAQFRPGDPRLDVQPQRAGTRAARPPGRPRRGHARQPGPGRGRLHSLARRGRAEPRGRRVGCDAGRAPTRRELYLPLPRRAGRDVLVPHASERLRGGQARPLRRARHRPAGATARPRPGRGRRTLPRCGCDRIERWGRPA